MNIPLPLSATWRHLLFLNYAVPPEFLEPWVPKGVELDLYDGQAYLSLVGLMFLNQKILGIPDPFHQQYEQVNLRFYVKRQSDYGTLHGTFFIKEIVPTVLVAEAARMFFNERYVTCETRHHIEEYDGMLRKGSLVEYGFMEARQWHDLSARIAGPAVPPDPNSAAFFTAHRLLGYSPADDGTIEYELQHPRWHIYPVSEARFDCNVEAVYGRQFVPYLRSSPDFAFVAAGSDVAMVKAVKI